ncbi:MULTISPECIES: cupin domain-containing protein [Pseudoalteromonas]|uniref:Cupin domain-containing protein n=1 Tax=Pseudoalteromonas rubra TaxID=43658 RepID=A0A5S3UTN4_9GAMM|nr:MULTISPECIES: cupin domain-containing protein [Pseudoalteromonas]MCG7563444.1 cupin domain-containing protein [Pseudoalteromonas sp. McH1-42]MEC4091415.1 cupin domain-containing protein [Pseudoalteromonas rubra]QPB82420.1 cupin domain-containing protein [Pseudoalteromonas rubra]
MLNKFTLLPPTSSRPGVELKMVDFDQFGEQRIPFEGGQFFVEPGKTSKPDTHDVSECWFIAQGQGIINYDGQEYHITQGDYLYFEPRKTHFVHNDGEQQLVIFTVWWMAQS